MMLTARLRQSSNDIRRCLLVDDAVVVVPIELDEDDDPGRVPVGEVLASFESVAVVVIEPPPTGPLAVLALPPLTLLS